MERKTRLRTSSSEARARRRRSSRANSAGRSSPASSGGEERVNLRLERGFERVAKSLADVLVRVGAQGAVQKCRKLAERF